MLKIILVTWRPMLGVSILMFMVDQRTSLSQGSPSMLRYVHVYYFHAWDMQLLLYSDNIL